MRILALLAYLGFFTVCISALTPILDSSVDDNLEIREGRFLIYTTTTTTTSFQLTHTLLSSIYRSCYTTIGAAITTCSITKTLLVEGTARKKRSLLEQQPVLKVRDTLVPYADYISASKVLEEANWHDEDQRTETLLQPNQATQELTRHPRLLTVLTTATVTANSTTTIFTTPLEVERLAFTSADANHCLPADIIQTLPACI